MALKFYTSVVNGLKLKIRKLGLTLTFVEVTGEKLVWVGPLLSPPPQISNRLDRAKTAVLKFVDLVSKISCLVDSSFSCVGGRALSSLLNLVTTTDVFHHFFLSDFSASSGKSFLILLLPLKSQKIIRKSVK